METDQISRIKQRLDSKGLSAAAASVAAGHGPDLLRNLFAGRSQNMRADTLARLSAVLGVTTQWILTGRDSPSSVPDDPRGSIAEINVRAGAGGGGLAEPWYEHDEDGNCVEVDNVKAMWSLPAEYLRGELRVNPKAINIVEVLGDSMFPTLLPGDRLLVDTSHKSPSPLGIYALWDGFGLIVKRIEIIPGTDPLRLLVSSDNPNHADRELTVEEAHVVGRVVARMTAL